VFVEQDARLGIAQQPGQRGLAVEKRAAPQILAIVLDQVEGIEDRGPRSLLSAQLINLDKPSGPTTTASPSIVKLLALSAPQLPRSIFHRN
jgi:hypothetical protein